MVKNGDERSGAKPPLYIAITGLAIVSHFLLLWEPGLAKYAWIAWGCIAIFTLSRRDILGYRIPLSLCIAYVFKFLMYTYLSNQVSGSGLYSFVFPLLCFVSTFAAYPKPEQWSTVERDYSGMMLMPLLLIAVPYH